LRLATVCFQKGFQSLVDEREDTVAGGRGYDIRVRRVGCRVSGEVVSDIGDIFVGEIGLGAGDEEAEIIR
jgi:hypothetical protein